MRVLLHMGFTFGLLFKHYWIFKYTDDKAYIILVGVTHTPLQKRTQVWFELQAKIPVAHEVMMQMLQENAKIKKIYRGTLTSVYIYTKKLFSKINNIFY